MPGSTMCARKQYMYKFTCLLHLEFLDVQLASLQYLAVQGVHVGSICLSHMPVAPQAPGHLAGGAPVPGHAMCTHGQYGHESHARKNTNAEGVLTRQMLVSHILGHTC